MALPPLDPTDPEALLTRTLALAVPLHAAIAAFDEPAPAVYRMSGAPGVAFFRRDSGDTISHVSGSPSPTLMPALDELRERYMRAIGAPDGTDNSHLPPLLMLCMYLADTPMCERLGIAEVAHRPAQLEPLDEEEGQHDPELEPLDAALRAWIPLEADHVPDAGVNPAILEIRFPAQRYSRHVPWEGAAGETGRVHQP